MAWVALTVALAQPPAPVPWRVVDGADLHVGLRPVATLDNENGGRIEGGVGVTVQVTAWRITF